MKIVTFINGFYADIAHNLYLQLEKIDRHKDLIIYCDNYKTANALRFKKLLCKIVVYVPYLGHDSMILLRDKRATAGYGSINYALLNFIKHDVVYQEIRKTSVADYSKYILYLDSDMIINADFIPDLVDIMEAQKQGYSGPANIGIKYYLNDNKNPSLHYNNHIGRRMIANCGFMVFFNHETTMQIIVNYYKLMQSFNVNQDSWNVDEIVLTDYLDNHPVNVCSIPDSINMLSDCANIYRLNDIRGLHTKSFHLTFYSDKKSILMGLNQWLTLQNLPDYSTFTDCEPDIEESDTEEITDE